MGKSKRNCRRTEDEVRIHEKAVKMRKMTDEQLVHYVEDRVEKARSEGFNSGKKESGSGKGTREFLEELQTSKIAGIGAVTINKLLKVATEHGYIQYRFKDGIVTLETPEGKRIWCGEDRKELYRPAQVDD